MRCLRLPPCLHHAGRGAERCVDEHLGRGSDDARQDVSSHGRGAGRQCSSPKECGLCGYSGRAWGVARGGSGVGGRGEAVRVHSPRGGKHFTFCVRSPPYSGCLRSPCPHAHATTDEARGRAVCPSPCRDRIGEGERGAQSEEFVAGDGENVKIAVVLVEETNSGSGSNGKLTTRTSRARLRATRSDCILTMLSGSIYDSVLLLLLPLLFLKAILVPKG
jgi:hypothetical protein